MKILTVLYILLLALVIRDVISDIKKDDFYLSDFLFPAIFILFGITITYLVLSA